MKLAMFYDTETTGLPLFDQPSEDPRQPHIVQLGACLVDLDVKKVVSQIDVVVKPEGWTIPEEVTAIHGISTEFAGDVGIPEKSAVEMLLDFWAFERLRIGHNEQFDARIIRIACMRHVHSVSDSWKSGKAHCTQLLSTPILKLPPTERMRAANRSHYKSANLREAYKHFTGRELENAHSAMADVRACMEVYFSIRDSKLPAEGSAA